MQSFAVHCGVMHHLTPQVCRAPSAHQRRHHHQRCRHVKNRAYRHSFVPTQPRLQDGRDANAQRHVIIGELDECGEECRAKHPPAIAKFEFGGFDHGRIWQRDCQGSSAKFKT